jgi:hypothetical protein
MTSILKVNQIQTTAGGVPTAGELGLNVTGTVLQVKFVNNNTQTAISGATPTNFMSISITPSSVNSKIWVQYDVGLSFDFGGCHAQSYIYRGSTPLGLAGTPDSNGSYANKVWFVDSTSDNNFGTVAGSYLDSPSTTSSVTYHTALSANNGNTMYANRRFLDAGHYMVSSMTIMEIAG